MFFSFAPPPIEIAGREFVLRTPCADDFGKWSRLREQSRAFLTPWEPVWPEDDLTRAGFRRRLRRYANEMRGDLAYPFLIWRAEDRTLLGGVTLANVRRGIVQTGTLGYWIGAPFAAQGIMTRTLRLLVPELFARLRLHRIEAACLPGNVPSIRLLEGAGFQREGMAREYLCINGQWQDHLLFARLHSDPPIGP